MGNRVDGEQVRSLEFGVRSRNLYLGQNRSGTNCDGFSQANRREARKLGLLQKQTFRGRTRAIEAAGAERACLRGKYRHRWSPTCNFEFIHFFSL